MSKTQPFFLSEHARQRLRQRQIEADWVDLVLKLGYSWKAKGARFYRLKPEIAAGYPIPLLQRLTVVVQKQTVITAYFDGILSAERYRKLLLKGRRKAWQKAQNRM
jgi:hypothetical protein